MFTLQRSKKGSARKQINIRGVKDGILILPHRQYRMVLEVSSINFELKSEEEQDALIDTYESFLNSLPCPLQIVVRVRELDISKYLADLKARLHNEKEEIYQQQISNYSSFIQSLVADNRILSRRFYVILPFEAKDPDFATVKEQLAISRDLVNKGLMRLGIHARQLESLEILDLFQSFYNEEQAKAQPITERAAQLISSAYTRGEKR